MKKTIKAIFKRSKCFHNPDKAVGVADFQVSVGASDQPQVLPEWVRETQTFQVGLADGSIVEMEGGK